MGLVGVEEEEMTTVVVNRKYLTKLVFQDLKRKWNRQGKEHELEEKFNPCDFYIRMNNDEMGGIM